MAWSRVMTWELGRCLKLETRNRWDAEASWDALPPPNVRYAPPHRLADTVWLHFQDTLPRGFEWKDLSGRCWGVLFGNGWVSAARCLLLFFAVLDVMSQHQRASSSYFIMRSADNTVTSPTQPTLRAHYGLKLKPNHGLQSCLCFKLCQQSLRLCASYLINRGQWSSGCSVYGTFVSALA